MINSFPSLLSTALALYFHQPCEYASLDEVPLPDDGNLLEQATGRAQLTLDERVVILLALMPHVCPQALDLFFVQNKEIGRPYTEFGGWKGLSHGGFLPTGETAAFMLAGADVDKRLAVMRLFEKEHWLYADNIVRLEDAGDGEPLLSGRLRVSDEFLSRVLHNKAYKPDFAPGFPARRIDTALEWDNLVLDHQTAYELEEINTWIASEQRIMHDWGLARFLKPGYRALFYGPPGTGKTLAATLTGKRNRMDVYRIDLSMVVSKYIGETEKNLARVFDLAANRRWILFFDEADALFGKRTEANTSNDRYANQEVAYLLQRIEDFPGTVILATNLRGNIDEAFARRFQSAIYFPMPAVHLRHELWKRMLPSQWLDNNDEETIRIAAETELSGGSIANVVRRCAIHLIDHNMQRLTQNILQECVQREMSLG